MKKLVVLIIITLVFFITPSLFADETIQEKYCHIRRDRETVIDAGRHARNMAIRNALESSRLFALIASTVEDFQITDDLIRDVAWNYSKNIETKYSLEGKIICCAIEWTVSTKDIYGVIKREVRGEAQPTEEKELLPPMVSQPKPLPQGPGIDIAVGIGKLSGDTTYRIGGTVTTPSGSYQVHFPISELQFPLDVFMVSVEGTIEFAEIWNVSVGVKKNITIYAGKMKDSDWGAYFLEGYPWAERDTLDVYSESDADLDALMVDIALRCTLYQDSDSALFVGLGYMRQYFDYEVGNLDQWYPSYYYYFGVDAGHYYVSGKVLAYEVTYSIPYMEIGTQLRSNGKLSVEATVGYSPIVDAEDRDNHILRSRVSEGDFDGEALLLSLEGRYDFQENWFLTLQASYTEIDTDGKSKTYVNGEYTHTIDQETESKQIFAVLSIGRTF